MDSDCEASAPLQAALIGVGHAHAWGKAQAIDASVDMELAGVFEPDAAEWERRRARDEFAGVRRLSARDVLQDPSIEVVFVETRPWDNLRWARAAVDHGKHVHLDKPPALSLHDLRAVLARAADRGVHVQMGYQFRYNPAVVMALRALREDWLGPVSRIHADIPTGIGIYARMRDELAAQPGGTFVELGCHLVDLIVLVLGKPTGVWSTLRSDAREQGDSFVDNTTAVLEYPQALAVVQSWVTGHEPTTHRRFEIIGERGSFLIEPIEPPGVRLFLESPAGPFPAGWSRPPVSMRPRYAGDIADLAAWIRAERPPSFKAEHDLAVHETLLRICRVLSWDGLVDTAG